MPAEPAISAVPVAADPGPSAGTLLRAAREAAGLHVAALAVSLKIPVRKLEALEQDQYEQLGDAVFVRALGASVCRALKIDAQPVLERLPQTQTPRLIEFGEGLNAPFRAPADGAGPGWFEQINKPVFLSVFALLLGALVLLLLPVVQRSEPAGTQADSVQGTAPAAAPQAAADPSTLTTPVVNLIPVTANPPVTVPVAVPAVAASPVAVVPAAAESPPAGGANPAGIIVFRAKGPSWVEVTDAKGGLALRRLLAAGESAAASGPLPLAVTVGSVNVTQVTVRGKAFDLAAVGRDNVARFEVK